MTILVQCLAFLYSSLWTTRPEVLHYLLAWRRHLFACRNSSLTKLNQGDDTLLVWRQEQDLTLSGGCRCTGQLRDLRDRIVPLLGLIWRHHGRCHECCEPNGAREETDTSNWTRTQRWSDSRPSDTCIDWWISSSGLTITQSNTCPCLWVD